MKKLVHIFISVVMLLSWALPCAAAPFEKAPEKVAASSVEELLSDFDYSKSVENAQKGYIDKRVSNDVLDRVNVSGADSYSIEYIGTVSANARSGAPEGTVYSVTATQKSVSNNNSEDNIDAAITMVWIDNLGTNNQLYRIYGNWNPNGRTLSNRLVTYGWNNINDSYYESMTPTSNSYNFYPLEIYGFQLSAVASVNSSGYESNPIMVEVSSSIFQ